MNKTKLPKKIESCGCDCTSEQPSDPSRRNFMKQATTLTMIGSTAFILQACGGGGSPTGPEDPGGGILVVVMLAVVILAVVITLTLDTLMMLLQEQSRLI